MRTAKAKPTDILPEYDFATMKGGVRGKYLKQYQAGTNLVLLEPEIAAAFPTADAVNQALRGLLSASKAIKRTPRPRRKNA